MRKGHSMQKSSRKITGSLHSNTLQKLLTEKNKDKDLDKRSINQSQCEHYLGSNSHKTVNSQNKNVFDLKTKFGQ